MKEIIKVGYLLSYDYEYIFTSLKQVYEYADKIIISYDINGKTWAGNDFHIPAKVFDQLKALDKDSKITLYGDNFFVPGKKTMELETRQRTMMAEKMGKGGWHLQIDSDEYVVDFEKLSAFLRKRKNYLNNPEKTPLNFYVRFVTLFKQDEDGYFIIDSFSEPCFMVTNVPSYEIARYPRNHRFLLLNIYCIHQSWARTKDEIKQKITNWGHNEDFDSEQFISKWNDLNKENYTGPQYRNFHPLVAETWKGLIYFEAKTIDEFIDKFSAKFPTPSQVLPKLSLKKKLKLYFGKY